MSGKPGEAEAGGESAHAATIAKLLNAELTMWTIANKSVGSDLPNGATEDGAYIATIQVAPGGWKRTFWRFGKGAGIHGVPDALCSGAMLEMKLKNVVKLTKYPYWGDKKCHYVVVAIDKAAVYLVRTNERQTEETGAQVLNLIAQPTDYTEALRSERQRLVARIAEIDKELERTE